MSLLNHETLVQTAYDLPPLPQTVTQLSDLFADPNYQLRDVVRAVSLDSSLAGKLLRLANSAVYGSRRVGSTIEAVARLGSGAVRSISIASSARPKHDLDLSAFGLTPDTYWKHSVTVLTLADVMATHGPAKYGDDFPTAALLHDFGKLVLSRHLTPEHSEALQRRNPELSAVRREELALSVNHAEVTAVVAQAWNLPDDLVRAVQHHHNPTAFDHPMCHGLNIANQLAWQLESRNAELERESASRATSMAALGLTAEQCDEVLEMGVVRLQETLDAYS
ncbi:MAG: HDOD domain-containing protein [Fuerstiella sp.]|nr:HDOD domain-containing protein [Fuerstiella sp.]MCP4785880.1 HDOD domain-containing protein [Fuerstiella sp.]MCP4857206.1 HDOD domain-containing protein [Fuerstiella sp.]